MVLEQVGLPQGRPPTGIAMASQVPLASPSPPSPSKRGGPQGGIHEARHVSYLGTTRSWREGCRLFAGKMKLVRSYARVAVNLGPCYLETEATNSTRDRNERSLDPRFVTRSPTAEPGFSQLGG